MEELFKVNDIVVYNTHYDNGQPNPVYSRITKIIWEGHEYNQLIVTTGCGDSNTNCLIHIDYICKRDTLERYRGNCYNIDPHKLYRPDFGEEIDNCLKNIEFNKKKIEFLNRHENPSRDQIIDSLLESN